MKNYLLILTMSLPFFQSNMINLFDLKIDHQANTEISIEKQELLKEWILTKGYFENDQLTFEAKDTKQHTYGMYQVFRFEEEGNIAFDYFNPSKIMICGNGLTNINEGSWTIGKDNELTLHLIGERFAESTFEYKIRYTIEQLDDKNLVLKEAERMISEVKSFY